MTLFSILIATLMGVVAISMTPKHGSWLNMAEIELSALA